MMYTKIDFPENSSTDFKSCLDGKLPKNIDHTIAAMANSHGGKIYFGVNDNGEILKLNNNKLDSIQKDLSTLMSTDNKFTGTINFRIELKDGYVVFEISESAKHMKPIRISKNRKTYVRRGSTTSLASPEEEMSMMIASVYGSAENRPIDNISIKDLNNELIDDYFKRALLDGVNISDNNKMEKLNILINDMPTLFGVLCFGDPSTDVSSNISVDFKQFSGKTKTDSSDHDEIYLDRKIIKGNLIHQFNESFKYLISKIPTKHILNNTTGLREEVRIVPEVALRETLANAIAHRDYANLSSSINVDIYSDRVEISNPGESMVPIEEIEKTSSKARNPKLMELFRRYGVTESTARGIPIIKESIVKRGLLSPKFENLFGEFRATLFFSTPHSEVDSLWVEEFSRFNLRESQKNALVYARNNGYITNGIYCNINNMISRNDNQKALREIKDMIKKGILQKEGSLKNTKYKLTK